MTTPTDPNAGGISVPTFDDYMGLQNRVANLESITGAQGKQIQALIDAGKITPPGGGTGGGTGGTGGGTGGGGTGGGGTGGGTGGGGTGSGTGISLSPQGSGHPGASTQNKWLGSANTSAFTGMPINLHRIYYGIADSGFTPDAALAAAKADALSGRLTVISIGRGKTLTAWPTTVDTGKLAQFIPAFLANPNTIIVPHHEPENSVGSQTVVDARAGYRSYFQQMVSYLRPRVPQALFAPILMAWTGRPGGPGWDAWIPDPAQWDIFCCDGYSHGDNNPLASSYLYGSLAYAKSKNRPLLVTECGQINTANQSRYLTDMVQWIKSDPMHWGAAYWNSTGPQGAYGLTAAGLATFKQLLTDPAFKTANVKPVG